MVRQFFDRFSCDRNLKIELFSGISKVFVNLKTIILASKSSLQTTLNLHKRNNSTAIYHIVNFWFECRRLLIGFIAKDSWKSSYYEQFLSSFTPISWRMSQKTTQYFTIVQKEAPVDYLLQFNCGQKLSLGFFSVISKGCYFRHFEF